MNVAILDDYQGLALQLADWGSLPPGTEVVTFRDPIVDTDELVRCLEPFEIIVAMRERTGFPESVIARLPRLRLIASTGMRNAAIDVEACRRRNVEVLGSPGARVTIPPTAELTWALILAVTKRVVESHNALHAGRWQPAMAGSVSGKVLGIVGLGNLGTHVARIGRAFGMEVIAWSPHLTAERAAAAGVTAVDKNDLFARADVVSLHLVLGATTEGVVRAAELEAMKPGAILINAARAGLVDRGALLAALRDRRIAGAGLDVFDDEPLPPSDALLALDNVVLTPHLGYVTPENVAAFYAGVVENIRNWMAGKDTGRQIR